MYTEIAYNRYNFNIQEEQLEIMSSITHEDFFREFESVFFSKHTLKRLDFSLTSKKFAEEQKEYIEKNKETEVFKDHIVERVRAAEGTSIEKFKEDIEVYPDFFKENYAKFVSKLGPRPVDYRERTFIMIKPDGVQRGLVG